MTKAIIHVQQMGVHDLLTLRASVDLEIRARIVGSPSILTRARDVVNIADAHFGFDVAQRGRKAEVVRARMMVMAYLRHELYMTYKSIGLLLGHLDHSTVLHNIGNHHYLCDVQISEYNRRYLAEYNELITKINKSI